MVTLYPNGGFCLAGCWLIISRVQFDDGVSLPRWHGELHGLSNWHGELNSCWCQFTLNEILVRSVQLMSFRICVHFRLRSIRAAFNPASNNVHFRLNCSQVSFWIELPAGSVGSNWTCVLVFLKFWQSFVTFFPGWILQSPEDARWQGVLWQLLQLAGISLQLSYKFVGHVLTEIFAPSNSYSMTEWDPGQDLGLRASRPTLFRLLLS